MAQQGFKVHDRVFVDNSPGNALHQYGTKLFFMGDGDDNLWHLMSSTTGGMPTNDNGSMPWLEVSQTERIEDITHFSAFTNVRFLTSTLVGTHIHFGAALYAASVASQVLGYAKFDVVAGTWAKSDESEGGTATSGLYWDNLSGTDTSGDTITVPQIITYSENDHLFTFHRRHDEPNVNTNTTYIEAVRYTSNTWSAVETIAGPGTNLSRDSILYHRPYWDGTSSLTHIFWSEDDDATLGTHTYTEEVIPAVLTLTLSYIVSDQFVKHRSYDHSAGTYNGTSIVATYGRNTQPPYRSSVWLSGGYENMFTNGTASNGTAYMGVMGAGTTGTGTGSNGAYLDSVIEFDPTSATPSWTVNNITDSVITNYGFNAGRLVVNNGGNMCLVKYVSGFIDAGTTTEAMYEGSGYDRRPFVGYPTALIYHTKGTSTVWSTASELFKMGETADYEDALTAGTSYVQPSEAADAFGTYFVNYMGYSSQNQEPPFNALILSTSVLPSGMAALFTVGWSDVYQSADLNVQYMLGTITSGSTIRGYGF